LGGGSSCGGHPGVLGVSAGADEPAGILHVLSDPLAAGGVPGLASAMSERLQIPVEIADPFRLLTISRQADTEFIRQHASTLAVSAGLATRRPGDK